MVERSGHTTTKLAIKVVPGASRTAIAGWMGDALKIRVSPPPERGKANAAVVALLARVLELPQARVRIVSGGASAHKVVEIEGLTDAELQRRLSGFSSGQAQSSS